MQNQNIIVPYDIIRLAFPNGTDTAPISGEDISWQSLPDWPPDLFGICAHLLEMAGAYHYLTPGVEPICEERLDIQITIEDRKRIEKDAAKWREDPSHRPAWAKKSWSSILKAKRALHARRQNKKSKTNEGKRKIPSWWKSATMLAAYADEACRNIGHKGQDENNIASWMNATLLSLYSGEKREKLYAEDQKKHDYWFVSEGLKSISAMASEDLFCVQPKSRTPALGCTIRSMSLNLSLLPPAGTLQAAWQQMPSASIGGANTAPFNCLFIPYPYMIEDEAFKLSGKTGKRWKWFEVEQTWLPKSDAQKKKFLKFIERMIDQADSANKNTSGNIVSALVFPELSLTWDLHELIVDFILKKCAEERKGKNGALPKGHEVYNNIQFLITGSSTNCKLENGNYILTTQLGEEVIGVDRVKYVLSTSRSKHHRWKIEQNQIRAYKLKGEFEQLTPNQRDSISAYWEKIRIPRRRFHIHTFRDYSVLTTLICEDLARAEPVHKYVRAVGPDILFVMLMDGCQIEQRWPARYALGLAEDPGSTVVTFTSRGLVRRSNEQRSEGDGYLSSWSVGLARNPSENAVQIRCEPKTEGVLLQFRAMPSHELTLDGRRKSSGYKWTLQTKDILSVALDRTKDRNILVSVVRDFTD